MGINAEAVGRRARVSHGNVDRLKPAHRHTRTDAVSYLHGQERNARDQPRLLFILPRFREKKNTPQQQLSTGKTPTTATKQWNTTHRSYQSVGKPPKQLYQAVADGERCVLVGYIYTKREDKPARGHGADSSQAAAQPQAAPFLRIPRWSKEHHSA